MARAARRALASTLITRISAALAQFAILTESVARLPFGQPVRDPEAQPRGADLGGPRRRAAASAPDPNRGDGGRAEGGRSDPAYAGGGRTDPARARLAVAHSALHRAHRPFPPATDHLATARDRRRSARPRRRPAGERRGGLSEVERRARRSPAPLSAARKYRSDRPCAYRPGLALALSRDAAEIAPNFPYRAVADRALGRFPLQSIDRALLRRDREATIRPCSRASSAGWRRVSGN